MLSRTSTPNATRFAGPISKSFSQVLAKPLAPRPTSRVTDAQHLSLITYEIPKLRAAALLPQPLRNAGFTLQLSKGSAQLLVVSYLDQPVGRFGVAAAEAFEQTSYWLLVQKDSEIYHWQINVVVGSLIAVSSRNLWQAPWHLGAMEFQARFDDTRHAYQSYRLETQSEHLNASWEIADSGRMSATHLPLANIQECYLRNDGGIDVRQLRFLNAPASEATLLQARCELLERHGLLTEEEITHPVQVMMCHRVTLEIGAATRLATEKSPAYSAMAYLPAARLAA